MPAVDPLSAALEVGQTILGTVQAISGSERTKRLLQQRRAYKTPEEYFKILNATENLASEGFDAFTLNYLTSGIDRSFSEASGTAERLGANPNDLSSLLDQKIQGLMKVGAENHQLNMENFSKFLGALDVMGQNKAAEWKSQQDIIKDQLQSAAEDKQAGLKNIFSAANAAIGTDAAGKTGKLFSLDDLLKALKGGGAGDLTPAATAAAGAVL